MGRESFQTDKTQNSGAINLWTDAQTRWRSSEFRGGPMKSTLLASAFLWLTCFLLATSCAHAQGVGASGDIVGTVTDPSGAVVPKVAVVAVEISRGTQYAAI